MSRAMPSRRRIVSALAVSALLAAPALAACGSSTQKEASKGNVTLNMAVWGGKLDEEVYKERLALAKKKYPNITVNLQITAGGENYADKLSTAIAGGKGPDILELAEHTPAFASKHQVIPLDDYIGKDKLDVAKTYGDKVGQIFRYDDKQYAIPDRSGAMVLYYNKDMFDAAKVEYPTKDWSQEDLLAAAKKLTISQGGKVKQWGFATIDWWPYWMTWMYQNGGKVLDENNKPIVNSPENIEAMQAYVDLAWKHKVSPTPRDFANYGKGVGPDQLFAQKKLAMEITGFWNIGALASVKDVNWDIAPLWHGKQPATSAFFNGLAISSSSKYPADAWKVIHFLTSEAGQRPIIDKAEDAPANLMVQNSDAFLKPKWATKQVNMAAFAESAEFIYVPPLTTAWNEMMKVFTDNMSGMLANKVSPKQTLDTIQARLEKVMARAK